MKGKIIIVKDYKNTCDAIKIIFYENRQEICQMTNDRFEKPALLPFISYLDFLFFFEFKFLL